MALAIELSEREKIRWTGLGLVKKDKQLDESKLCSFFAKPQKQRCPSYFSSNTKKQSQSYLKVLLGSKGSRSAL
jgi:hypothetical protein